MRRHPRPPRQCREPRTEFFFLRGVDLPDPKKLLEGEGSTVRSIVLQNADDLDKPPVRALMKAALKARPIDPAGEGRLVIRMISKKQRPRRPR